MLRSSLSWLSLNALNRLQLPSAFSLVRLEVLICK